MPYVWRRKALRADSPILRFTIAGPQGYAFEADEEGAKIVCYDEAGERHMIRIAHLTLGTVLDWAGKEKARLEAEGY